MIKSLPKNEFTRLDAPGIGERMKKCRRCGKTKPVDDFYSHRPSTRRGFWHDTHCKECAATDRSRRYWANPEKARKRERQRYATNPHKATTRRRELRHANPGAARVRRQRWRKTGMTLERFNEMMECQGGRCVICGVQAASQRYGRLSIDHNHDTTRSVAFCAATATWRSVCLRTTLRFSKLQPLTSEKLPRL